MTKQELINLFVNEYSMDLRDAKILAIRNIELKARLNNEIVRFTFKKKDGTIRVAVGTLVQSMLPAIKGAGKANKSVQTYYDTEKQQFRSFKRINLLSIDINKE